MKKFNTKAIREGCKTTNDSSELICNDVEMEFSDLKQPNPEIFTQKYQEIIMPLSTLAKNSGFDCDWVY